VGGGGGGWTWERPICGRTGSRGRWTSWAGATRLHGA